MLLNISEDHKTHLQFLLDTEPEVIENFASLSLEFLKSGISRKTFNNAAQKLSIAVETVENAVQGLMQLFTEGARFLLSGTDFHDSLLLIGFSPEVCKILTTMFLSNFKESRNVLNKIVPSVPTYDNMEWRLDIKLASRSLHNQISPIIYMKITTFDGKKQVEYVLQTDITNLIHMTKVLEEALNEMKSNHCRRILRNIK